MFHTNIVEKIKTHFVFNNFLLFENCAISGLMRRYIVDPCRPQMKIRHICTSRHVPIATNTHSEYAILIAFPLQQLLHQHISMLRHTYIEFLVYYRICPEYLSLQVTSSDNTLFTDSDRGRVEPVFACDEEDEMDRTCSTYGGEQKFM